MTLKFSDTLRDSLDFTLKNYKEYARHDFKYFFYLFIGIILTFVLYGLYVYNEYVNSGNELLSQEIEYFSLIFVFLIYLWVFIGIYYVNWLMVVKSYHVLKTKQNFDLNYKTFLRESKKFRVRSFIGILVTGFITVLPILIWSLSLTFIIPEFRSSFHLANIIGIILIYFVVLIVMIYFLYPLQLYPSLLVIEDNLGYFEGIKRVYSLFSSWKIKIKFIIIHLILGSILNLFIQTILTGIVFILLFVILILVLTLALSSETIFILILSFGLLLFIFFIILSVAFQVVLVGNYFGVVYNSLTDDSTEKGEQSIPTIYKYGDS